MHPISGLKGDEDIVAGSYQAIRDLKDNTRVRNGGGPDSARAGGN